MKKLLLTAALLLLAGCATAEPERVACPQAGILSGAGQLPIFTGQQAVQEDIKVKGEIVNFSGGCRYKQAGVSEFQLTLNFLVQKTPKAGGLKKIKLPYFVAVLSPDETVLQKSRFWTNIDFDNNESAVTEEEHDLRVPFSGTADARNYKIVFGFELTQDQLDFNKGKTP